VFTPVEMTPPPFADAPVAAVSPANLTVNSTEEAAIYCTYESNPVDLISVAW